MVMVMVMAGCLMIVRSEMKFNHTRWMHPSGSFGVMHHLAHRSVHMCNGKAHMFNPLSARFVSVLSNIKIENPSWRYKGYI